MNVPVNDEREARLKALRATLDASIAMGGSVTNAQLDRAIKAKASELRRRGIGA